MWRRTYERLRERAFNAEMRADRCFGLSGWWRGLTTGNARGVFGPMNDKRVDPAGDIWD